MAFDRRWAGTRLRGAAPYLALTALVVAVFADPLFTGRTFFYRDLGLSMRPTLLEARTAAGGGTDLLPLWSHMASNGRPMLANPGFALLAPLDLLFAVLPFPAAFNLFLVLHVVIAGCAMVFLARRLGCGPAAAFAAGAAYSLGGGIFSALTLYWTLVAAAWAPFVVAAGIAAVSDPAPRSCALLALVIGIQMLGGQPEVIAATIVVGVVLSLAVAQGSRAARLGRAAAAWAAGIAGGLAVAAAQLVPAALHARTTLRGLGFTAEGMLVNSLHPLRALWMFVPRMGGNPFDALRPGGFPGVALLDSSSPYLISLYVGAVTAAAAVAGLAVARRQPATRAIAVALAGLAVAGCVAAFGRFLPGVPTLIAHLPIHAVFRFPEKALYVTFLAVPILGALGIDALRASMGPRLALSLAAAVAIDLALTHRGYAPTLPVADLAMPPLARELIDRSRGLGVPDGAWRVHHQRDRASGGWGPPAGSISPREDEFFRWQVRMLMPPTAAAYGIRAAMEPQGDLLDDVRYYGLVRSAYTGPAGALPRALGEAGVLWVLSPRPDLEASTGGELVRELALGESEGVAAGSGYVYRNTRFVPRARVASGYSVIATPPLRELTALANRRYAAAEPWPPATVVEAAPDPGPAGTGGEAGRVESIDEDHRGLELTAQAGGTGVVVVSDAPGALEAWSARVDGEPAPVWRANFAYLVVPVTAGRHRIRLDYRPRGLRAGFAVSLAALAGVAVACRPRRHPAVDPPR